jgi:serine protease Do
MSEMDPNAVPSPSEYPLEQSEIHSPSTSAPSTSGPLTSAPLTSAPSPSDSTIHSDSNVHVISRQPTAASLLLSTFLSLVVVLVLLVALRFMLPSMLEFSRYAWHRGQLRAEYEMAGQQLERVSWEGLNHISETVAKRTNASVVHITMSAEASEPDNFYEDASVPSRRPKVGQGSGIIADTLGHIVTNYHVLDEGSKIHVILADERTCVAQLVGFDKLTDLAVLKINADELFPITWGDSDCIEVGSPVWAIGSPFGLTGSITFGILSSKHRLDLSGTSYDDSIRNAFPRGAKRKASAKYSDLMQSDVAVNPGNSGGPLVNGRGEMIGINTAIIGESYRGVSFSIPSNVVRSVFNQILETGKMRRGWIGVELAKASQSTTELQPTTANTDSNDLRDIVDLARLPLRGAVVRGLVDKSPASRAGLQVGDTIVEINGLKIRGVEDLIFEIGKSPVGSKVQLTIDREGERIAIEITVGERPDLP